MSSSHRPRPPRRYGEQPRSLAGRHFIQTQVRTDVYLRIRELMEARNLSASGAVHHLLREGLLQRTARGRVLTPEGFAALGLDPGETPDAAGLFD